MEYLGASLNILELLKNSNNRTLKSKKIKFVTKKKFDARLRRIRQDLGLTQAKCGDLVQVFSLYERGNMTPPIHTIIILAKMSDMSSDKLSGIK